MRRALAGLILAHILLLGCAGGRAADLVLLRATFLKPEYQGGHDGWGAARRRRLLAQFLQSRAIDFETVTESRSLRNPHDKYRKVHLRTLSRGEKKTKITYLTYVLDAAQPLQQKRCDDLLFAGLARLGDGSGQTVQFGMDSACQSGE